MGINNIVKAHCIVKTSLDISCSMRCGTVKIRNTYSDWFYTAFEIWSNWSNKNSKLILISRLNTDYRINTEHIWADVKSCSASERWYPIFICFYNIKTSLDKSVFREDRHFQTLAGTFHALSIQVWTECNDFSIFCCIGFKSFKTSLCILKYTGTFIHCDGVVCREFSFVPVTIFEICNETF